MSPLYSLHYHLHCYPWFADAQINIEYLLCAIFWVRDVRWHSKGHTMSTCQAHSLMFPTSIIASLHCSPTPLSAFPSAVLRRVWWRLDWQAHWWILSDVKKKMMTPLRISWMNSLKLCFSNLNTELPGGFAKTQIAALPPPSFWFSRTGWGLRIYFSNKFQGPHMENHYSIL